MAVSACCRELLSDVVWIGGGVIIVGMTTCTGVWCIVVIAVVAGCTVIRDRCVCPDQLIEVIVNGERSWRPSGICGMTCFTGGGQIESQVTRISAVCIIIGMATGAGVGRVCIVTLVTIVARHGGMRTHNRIE